MNQKKQLLVSQNTVREYERQSGLEGICQLLEKKGLIKITNDVKTGEK